MSHEELRKGLLHEPEKYINDVVYPGRRFMSKKNPWCADSVVRDLHDEIGGDGRIAYLHIKV